MTLIPRLPKRYESKEIEAKWQKYWDEKKLYSFDKKSKAPIYSVDTPPPTVSGNLHIGHVFSYTHTEIQARYYRMKGFNVYYPMGWDDNGLPSERLTEKELSQEAGKQVIATDLPRQDFINRCLEVTKKYEKQMENLWRSMGMSLDWNLTYTTIEDRTRRISQRSFMDLYKKGRVYRSKEPMIWCPECRTAIAQAEIETRPLESFFNDILFKLEDGKDLLIATTRPELLPACVAIFVHPDDKRYKKLVGQKATVPLFGHPVEIMADDHADPEKGTGVVMCCTFGDRQDVQWWKTRGLELRLAITEDGKLNDLAGPYKGLSLKEARQKIIEDMKKEGLLDNQKSIVHEVQTHERCHTEVEFLTRPQWLVKVLDLKEELVKQADKINWFPAFMKNRYVNWVENLAWDWCISRQRFFGVAFPVWHCNSCGEVILAEEKDLPVDPLTDPAPTKCKCGRQDLQGDTDVMDTWATSSLTPDINWGWGEKDEMKNLHPMSLRPQAHEIIRTWAFYTITKSYLHHGAIPWENVAISGFVTPPKELFKLSKKEIKDLDKGNLSPNIKKIFQENESELSGEARMEVLEKGKRWIFIDEQGEFASYYLVKKDPNTSIPWVYDGLDEYRKRLGGDDRLKKSGKAKISKSKHGDKYSPLGLLDRYSADCLRLWAASAPLGSDLPLDLEEEDFKTGQKFLTKIWNAYRFSDIHLQGPRPEKPEELMGIDAYMLHKLNETIDYSSRYFEAYDFRTARLQMDQFFKSSFCDDYIEIVKDRLYNKEEHQKDAIESGKYTLYLCAYNILRLYAPFIPHITEELYQLLFREKEGFDSIHLTGWPEPLKLKDDADFIKESGRAFLTALYYIRKIKGKRQMSLKDEIDLLTVKTHESRVKYFEKNLENLKATAKIKYIVFETSGFDKDHEARIFIEGEEEEIFEFVS